jgi:hypothetical protein
MRDLLLLLCRYPFDQTNRESLSRLIKEVGDWQSFIKLINDHGIIALAAYNIKEADLSNEIPADAMAYLNRGYMQSVMRNAWLTERWKEVNGLLNSSGIKHILLKGMALEHTVYGSRGLRQMNDNDILIKENESVQAWNLLIANGFSTEAVKSPLFNRISKDIYLHLPVLTKNGYAVEIHSKLFSSTQSGGSSGKDPFKDSVEIEIAGQPALILDRDLNISYLIKHLEGHKSAGDCQLRLYADIEILDNNTALSIPDSFLSEPLQGNKPEYRKASFRANLKLLPRNQRLLYLIGDTFPSYEWMMKRYNCKGVWLLMHYPLRIAKLFWLL